MKINLRFILSGCIVFQISTLDIYASIQSGCFNVSGQSIPCGTTVSPVYSDPTPASTTNEFSYDPINDRYKSSDFTASIYDISTVYDLTNSQEKWEWLQYQSNGWVSDPNTPVNPNYLWPINSRPYYILSTLAKGWFTSHNNMQSSTYKYGFFKAQGENLRQSISGWDYPNFGTDLSTFLYPYEYFKKNAQNQWEKNFAVCGPTFYSQQDGLLYAKRYWTEFAGTVPGTHGVIPKIVLDKMVKMNGSLVQVINVAKNGSLLASGYLVRGNGDLQNYNNLVIFSDGFDPGNTRRVQDIATNPLFSTLVDANNSVDNFSPIVYGYDVVFVDYAEGAGDIRDNAKAYLKIVETLCEKAGSKKVVVGGFSMGGLISRLAMLYGQKIVNGSPCAKIQNVSKFIAADSPLQGAAGIPLSLQSFIKKYAPLQYPALNNPAAKQMLYEHIESFPNTNEHNNFYAFLNAMGNYPVKIPKYSIANSDWNVPYDGQPYHYTFRGYVSDQGSALITQTACANAGLVDLILPGFAVWVATATCNPLAGAVLTNTTIVKETISFSGHCLAAGSSINLLKDIVISDDETVKKGFNFFLNADDNEASLYYNGVLRRPTFMPIYSVFDLKSDTPKELQNAQNLDRLCREKWSPFDKIYLCPDGRLEHITFTQNYLKQLVAALKDRATDISPILNLLLLD